MALKPWIISILGCLLIVLSACGGTMEVVASAAHKTEHQLEESLQKSELANGDLGASAVNHLAKGGEAKQKEASPAFIYRGGASYSMHDYLWKIVKDVDVFWTAVWKEAYQVEPFVYVSFPGPGERVPIMCGIGYSDDSTSLYCPEDDQLVISQTFASDVWQGKLIANTDPLLPYKPGDFSIAFYVAHEYAHALQEELGLLAANAEKPVRDLELHADCFAGVWAKSVYNRGELETGDLEEVMRTAHDGGDYSNDPVLHHGTPKQRYAAFKIGYDNGVAGSCDRYLQ